MKSKIKIVALVGLMFAGLGCQDGNKGPTSHLVEDTLSFGVTKNVRDLHDAQERHDAGVSGTSAAAATSAESRRIKLKEYYEAQGRANDGQPTANAQ